MKRRILSIVLLVIFIFSCNIVYAETPDALNSANALNRLGLFEGTGHNADGSPRFALDREPTRNEAITMLVRLLGKESEALNGDWETPFNDLTEWAKPYIGYAYANKLTDGTSATTFSGEKPVTATQFLTFVLRSLGYSSDSDFMWDKAWLLSDDIGITNGEYTAENNQRFFRSDIVEISESALVTQIKDSEQDLLDRLVKENAVSEVSANFFRSNPVYLTGLSIPSVASMQVNEEITITPILQPQDCTERDVFWTSSNEDIVSIDSSGKAVAKNVGSAIITVMSNSGIKAECSITVSDKEIVTNSNTDKRTSIDEINYGNIGFYSQESHAPDFGVYSGVKPAYEFERNYVYDCSELDAKYETFNDIWYDYFGLLSSCGYRYYGLVDNNRGGSLLVYTNAETKHTLSIGVLSQGGRDYYTIQLIPEFLFTCVDSVSIYGASSELDIGKSLQLYATILPENSTNKTVVWNSSDTNIAIVSSDGLVTAKSVGTVIITATANNGLQATYKITTNDPIIAVSRIIINGQASSIEIGKTIQLSATIWPENATNKTIVWNSSDTRIATVSSNGLVTAKTAGSVNITATANNGIQAVFSVTVNPQEIKTTVDTRSGGTNNSPTKQMKVYVSTRCIYNDSVGHDWGFGFYVNGNSIQNGSTISVVNDSTISTKVTVVENDNVPDYGTSTYSVRITDSFYDNGFTVTHRVVVRENRGRYSGNTAEWEIIFSFK